LGNEVGSKKSTGDVGHSDEIGKVEMTGRAPEKLHKSPSGVLFDLKL
jgi:hypothetical protein